MGVEAGIEQPGQVGSEGQTQGFDAGTGMNPAWNEVLQIVPQNLHSQLVPHLQKWDAGVTQKFQQLQSKLKPYETFESDGVTPDQLGLAVNIMQALEQQPEEVWRQLGARYGFGQQTGQKGGLEQETPSEDMWEGVHPDFRNQFETLTSEHEKLKEVAGIMAQMLSQQQEDSTSAADDAELDKLYQELAQKDPVFASLNEGGMAEPFINSLLMAEVAPEDALKALHAFTDHVMKVRGRPSAPRVLGAGGMVPGQGIDIKKATNQQARDAVAAIIAAGAAEE